MTYLQFEFKINPLQPASDILIAELSEMGFESFVETTEGLTGYIKEDDFSNELFESLWVLRSNEFEISYSKKKVQQQNWNAKWEADFKPIVIEDLCRIRASFHPKGAERYDIVIDPKMSFGTGHHETTYMMLQHILENDFKEKKVLDMGCGTGVLAILAEKRGGKDINAIDIDSWCVENTAENIERNLCKKIKVQEGGAELLGDEKYDTILANINRNILLDQIPIYAQCLKSKGTLFLSGFYSEDLEAISLKCSEYGLHFEKKLEKNKWVSAKYVF